MTPRLQACRAPAPGRPFVDREDELTFIEAKLRPGLRGERMAMVVTCFWGASGIGKSWLLGELERLYHRDGPQGTVARPTISARLDLDRAVGGALWQNDCLDLALIVQELWRQLAQQLGAAAPQVGESTVEDYAMKFVEQVTAWLAQATPLILLDTMDSVVQDDENAFFWLEEHLIEPLALTDRVLFIVAGRGELRRWRRFQVRRRIDVRPLSTFDFENAGREVRANLATSQALYRHAFGHPLATEYLGTILEEQGLDLSIASDADLSAALEPGVVRVALRAAVNRILEKAPESLAQLARCAAVLRWVNVEPLRAVAQGLNLVGSDRGEVHYLDLIGQLQTYHLLYWNVETASYEFASALRRLFAYSLELDSPADFATAHLAAYNYHREHVECFPQYLARYAPEAAYHCSVLIRSGGSPEGVPAFSSWWKAFLAQARVDGEPWVELDAAIAKDPELRATMISADYEFLSATVHERSATAQPVEQREQV